MFSSRFFDRIVRSDPFLSGSSPFDNDPFFNSAPMWSSSRVEQPALDSGAGNRESVKNIEQPQQQQPAVQDKSQQLTTQQQSRGDSLLAPFEDLSRGWFGSDFGRMLRSMDRVMDRMLDGMDVDWVEQPDGSSYTSRSSKVITTDKDGKTFERESHSESRRVGEVLEERSNYRDSLGNERSTERRGLKKQLREIVSDRNAKGEQRQVQNLRHIKPDKVEEFNKQWEQAVLKVDPEKKFLAGGQAKLTGGTEQKQIGSGSPKSLGADTKSQNSLPDSTRTEPSTVRSA